MTDWIMRGLFVVGLTALGLVPAGVLYGVEPIYPILFGGCAGFGTALCLVCMDYAMETRND